jgi:hypothetical protein
MILANNFFLLHYETRVLESEEDLKHIISAIKIFALPLKIFIANIMTLKQNVQNMSVIKDLLGFKNEIKLN